MLGIKTTSFQERTQLQLVIPETESEKSKRSVSILLKGKDKTLRFD